MAPFAKLFYDIYKIVAPAQTMFKLNDNPTLYLTKDKDGNNIQKSANDENLEKINEENILNSARIEDENSKKESKTERCLTINRFILASFQIIISFMKKNL